MRHAIGQNSGCSRIEKARSASPPKVRRECGGENNDDDDSTCRNVIYGSGIGIDDHRPRWCHAYSHVSAEKQKQPRDFYSNLIELQQVGHSSEPQVGWLQRRCGAGYRPIKRQSIIHASASLLLQKSTSIQLLLPTLPSLILSSQYPFYSC